MKVDILGLGMLGCMRRAFDMLAAHKGVRKAVLAKTYGVPLFREQAMTVVIEGAEFTPARADELRKAMAMFKYTQGVGQFKEELIEDMARKGIGPEFAERGSARRGLSVRIWVKPPRATAG